ncbi:MAG TPA: RNA pseudouridine synthase, partial [Porphyromonadaceae bacterium]|nr:RNA pseudouridine synthase [Porphyromonadaceae bacterium]
VYDLLQPDGFFKIEEEQISRINHQIKAIETNGEYLSLKLSLQSVSAQATTEISNAKQAYKAAKQKREQLRSTEQDEAELAAMVKESQYQKAEIKRLEKRLKEEIASIEQKLATFTSQIEALKHERKTRSARLQMQLFDQFQLLNANGETKGLCAIFESTAQKTPPAGAAECAGPKLLQYAYLNGMKPLAMAEFWWGDSPKTEIRKHGFYYPAC